MFHSHKYSNLRDSFLLRGGCDIGPKDSKQICNYVYSVLKKKKYSDIGGLGEIIIIIF